MSKQTTALLSVGPLTTGHLGDVEPWRVSSQSQLVEGGIPYWLVTLTQPAEHAVGTDVLVVEFPDANSVVASVLMLAATWHGGESVVGYLMDTENVTMDDSAGDCTLLGTVGRWPASPKQQAKRSGEVSLYHHGRYVPCR